MTDKPTGMAGWPTSPELRLALDQMLAMGFVMARLYQLVEEVDPLQQTDAWNAERIEVVEKFRATYMGRGYEKFMDD